MSIRVMTMVSDLCVYQSGMLLVLQVLADCSDDEGYNIFPARDLIAARARMTERNVQGCVARMREDGVLVLLDDDGGDLPACAVFPGGRGKVPRYRLNLAQLRDMQAAHKQVEPRCPWCEARAKRAKRATQKGEDGDTKGRKIEHPIKKEPSLPINTPSAAAAAGGPPKGEKAKLTKIGDYRPDAHSLELATAYWTRKGRPDLVAQLADIVEHFRAHHRSAGSRKEDWPATWQTWYSNQPNMIRPPRDGAGAPPARLAATEGVTVEAWVYRLVAWFVGHPDDGGASGRVGPKYWHLTWGPKPTDREACKAPAEAWAEFKRLRPRAA